MADSFIQVYPDSVGKMIDTGQLTVSANTVQRQRMVIASDTSATGLAGVTARGTQGGAALAVQNLRDAGRTMYAASSAAATAGVVAEALMTLTPVRDGVAGAGVTTLPVTSGKALRLSALVVTVRASAAVASWARFSLRMNPSGAVTATSPIIAQVEVGTPAQVIGATQTVPWDVPDGIEFTGAMQFGISHIAAATTVLETVSLVGFEY